MPHNFQLPVEPHIAEQRSNRTSLSQARHDSSDRRPVSHGRAAPSALHDARSRPEVGLPSFVLASDLSQLPLTPQFHGMRVDRCWRCAGREDAESSSLDARAAARGQRDSAPTQDMSRYRCAKRTVIRTGSDPSSPRAGTLKVGEIVDALEELDLGPQRGGSRVRGAKGWVSKVHRDGSVLLEPLKQEAVPPPLPAAVQRRAEESDTPAAADDATAASAQQPAEPPATAPATPTVTAASDGDEDVAAALMEEVPATQRAQGRWSAAREAATTAGVIGTMRKQANIDAELEQAGAGDGSISAGTDRAQRVAAVMQNIEIFRVFKPARRRYLAEAMSLLEVDAGEEIIAEGEEGDAFYIIESGRTRVSKKDDDGVPQTLVDLGAGQHFGELALLENAPRAATVTAIDAVALLVLSRDDFVGIIGKMAALMRWNREYDTRKPEVARPAVGRTLKDRMSSLQTVGSEDAAQSWRSDMEGSNAGPSLQLTLDPVLDGEQADETNSMADAEVDDSVDLDAVAAMPKAGALSREASGGMTLTERLRHVQESLTKGNDTSAGRRSPDEELSQLLGRGHVRDRRLAEEANVSQQQAVRNAFAASASAARRADPTSAMAASELLRGKALSPQPTEEPIVVGTAVPDDTSVADELADMAELDDLMNEVEPSSPSPVTELPPGRRSWEQELHSKALVSDGPAKLAIDVPAAEESAVASSPEGAKLPPTRRSFEGEDYRPLSERKSNLGLDVHNNSPNSNSTPLNTLYSPRSARKSLESIERRPLAERVTTLTSQINSDQSVSTAESEVTSLVGTTLMCLKRSVLRDSANLASAKAGTMKQGTVSVVLGEAVVGGVHRVQFAEGWISVASNGERVLSEPTDRLESDSLASAGTRVAPPPIPQKKQATAAATPPAIPETLAGGAAAVEEGVPVAGSGSRRRRSESMTLRVAGGLSVEERKLQAQEDFEQRQQVQTRTDDGSFHQLEGRGLVRDTTEDFDHAADETPEYVPIAATDRDREDLKLQLSAAPLLQHLDEGELDAVVDMVTIEEFDPAVAIITEGEPGEAMYFLQTGDAQAETSKSAVIRAYEPGDFFGEMALLMDQPRKATVRSGAQGAECLVLDREAFEFFAGANEAIFQERQEAYANAQLDELDGLDDDDDDDDDEDDDDGDDDDDDDDDDDGDGDDNEVEKEDMEEDANEDEESAAAKEAEAEGVVEVEAKAEAEAALAMAMAEADTDAEAALAKAEADAEAEAEAQAHAQAQAEAEAEAEAQAEAALAEAEVEAEAEAEIAIAEAAAQAEAEAAEQAEEDRLAAEQVEQGRLAEQAAVEKAAQERVALEQAAQENEQAEMFAALAEEMVRLCSEGSIADLGDILAAAEDFEGQVSTEIEQVLDRIDFLQELLALLRGLVSSDDFSAVIDGIEKFDNLPGECAEVYEQLLVSSALLQ
jgi:CRP-like cAMP-binding protein